MERNDFCPLLESCAIYKNKVQHNEMVGLTYSSLYCLQVNKKYKACRRYQLYMELGTQVHRSVLPNSAYSPDKVTADLIF